MGSAITDNEIKNVRQRIDEKEAQIANADKILNLSDIKSPAVRHEGLRIAWIFAGASIYALGMNIFLQPLNLYAGGFMGFSQLFAKLLNQAGLHFGSLNLSGIIYYILNIPALVVAYKTTRRRFVVKSLLSVTLITVLLSVVPIPEAPVLEDKIANCIIAGLICGTGVGIILRSGASDGGSDTIGMILSQMNTTFSVGKIALSLNCILYGIMLFLFDIPTVIYSLIYAAFNSIATDRMHTQTISSQVLIITKMPDTSPLEIEVMGTLHRGMTKWKACGAYSGDEETILLILISKHEMIQLRNIVKQFDPKAFMSVTEGVDVKGNFLRKLV